MMMLENVVESRDLEIVKLKKNELDTRMVLEQNVIMLENTLGFRDQKIYDLEEEIKLMEETPLSFTKLCEKCEKSTEQQKDVELHPDENIPSTSKCGTCEYESDDENELLLHAQTKHNLLIDVQEFKCDICGLYLKTKGKLKTHLCKVSVINPADGIHYMRGWYDCNGCTQIYNSKLNEEVAWLHSKTCVLENCAPFRNVSKEDIEEAIVNDPVEHLNLEKFVDNGTILWPKIYLEIKPQPT